MLMDKPFLFFDCWYTLFTADLAGDLVRITDVLGVAYTKHFLKTFERSLMVLPEPNVRPGIRRLLAELRLPVSSSRVSTIAEMLEAGFDRQRPYDDTLAGLEALRRSYRLGLITNSSQAAFVLLSQTYHLPDRFDVIVTSYDVGTIKPDSRMFHAAAAQAGVPADQAIMVGDSPGDDYQGALLSGFAGAVLLDRRGRYPHHAHRITELSQLSKALESL